MENKYLGYLALVDKGELKRKADIFTKRTIRRAETVTSVDTASEALAVSIGERAGVDLSYMAQLSGKTEEAVSYTHLMSKYRWIPIPCIRRIRFQVMRSLKWYMRTIR